VDYVYICRPGDNEELRYSIRSVFKYATNPRVIVFGGRPSWYSGEYVAIKEQKSKFNNIHNAVYEIAHSDLVSENFVLMNDDFYLLKPFDGVTTYHGGSLQNKIDKYKMFCTNLRYANMLQATHDKLRLQGIEEPIDYDMHVPFPMVKSKLQETVKYKTLYRSTYGNLADVGGIEINDVKVYKNGPMTEMSFDYLNNDSLFISSLDGSFELILNDLLREEFPYASPLESDAKVSGNA
jgi:hypothetical protein